MISAGRKRTPGSAVRDGYAEVRPSLNNCVGGMGKTRIMVQAGACRKKYEKKGFEARGRGEKWGGNAISPAKLEKLKAKMY